MSTFRARVAVARPTWRRLRVRSCAICCDPGMMQQAREVGMKFAIAGVMVDRVSPGWPFAGRRSKSRPDETCSGLGFLRGERAGDPVSRAERLCGVQGASPHARRADPHFSQSRCAELFVRTDPD